MSKFKAGDKVIVFSCKQKKYEKIKGTVIETYPSRDGLVNRVGLEKPVENGCIFWFADKELRKMK